MDNVYDLGIAFICEGDTEKEFYLSLISFLCAKNGGKLEQTDPKASGDIAYIVKDLKRMLIIKFLGAGALTNMPKTGKWFEEVCRKGYSVKDGWVVFLCYDTEDYLQPISPFYEGDWKELRKKLSRAKRIVDLAAAADIEDVLLVDLPGICNYLGCDLIEKDELRGRKGATRMKWLFRKCGRYYHKGKRARNLIDALDMQKIISDGILPLEEVQVVFDAAE